MEPDYFSSIFLIENMPNIRDHDASVYLKLQGDALHIGGYEVNPCFWDTVDKKFDFGLFDLDYDVFGVHFEGAINRVPCLEKIGIKSDVCGPESFTPGIANVPLNNRPGSNTIRNSIIFFP